MLYFSRPADEKGRPSPRAWNTLALYGLIFCGGMVAGEFAGSELLNRWRFVRNSDPPFPQPFICVLTSIPWFFLVEITPGRRRWEQAVAPHRTSIAYIATVALVTGITAGWLILLASIVLPKLSADLIHAFALMVGPFPGMVWIIQRRHLMRDSESESYDEMSPAAKHTATQSLELESLAATESFGRRLGSLLFPNAVVALIGPLGAGKTHLARAIAEGLGISNPTAVTSPTFTLIHEYPARLPIFHFDAYRLNSADQFLDLGATEYYEAGGVCLIEWADRVLPALSDERLTIWLTPVDENRRWLEMFAVGERYQKLASDLLTPAAIPSPKSP
jgi:tRNA threonylcarbamoyladenosine biosynthesis protein TsaE